MHEVNTEINLYLHLEPKYCRQRGKWKESDVGKISCHPAAIHIEAAIISMYITCQGEGGGHYSYFSIAAGLLAPLITLCLVTGNSALQYGHLRRNNRRFKNWAREGRSGSFSSPLTGNVAKYTDLIKTNDIQVFLRNTSWEKYFIPDFPHNAQ